MRGVECKGTRVENLSPPLDDRSRPCTLMGAEGLARIICIDSLNSHDNLKFMFMRSLRLPKFRSGDFLSLGTSHRWRRRSAPIGAARFRHEDDPHDH